MIKDDLLAPARRGRPRGKVRDTKTVYLRLPNEMVDAIHVRARARQWTINRWVETVLQDALRRPAIRTRMSFPRERERERALAVGDGRDD